MNWNEVYSKYKDTELMDEFMWFYQGIANKDIKDIWGYLIVFAETKGYGIDLESCTIDKLDDIDWLEEDLDRFDIKDYEIERRMLWCTSKFFEVGK